MANHVSFDLEMDNKHYRIEAKVHPADPSTGIMQPFLEDVEIYDEERRVDLDMSETEKAIIEDEANDKFIDWVYSRAQDDGDY